MEKETQTVSVTEWLGIEPGPKRGCPDALSTAWTIALWWRNGTNQHVFLWWAVLQGL